MRKLLLPALLAAALGTAACTDPYGNVDPVATGLLGAGIGAVAGAAIVAANQPRYHAPRGPGWGYGRPVYHRPHYAWGPPRPRYW
ncbi:hypothetical protein [Rubritepida flocculans]|uniref:hypothetical protein n=1 Tax=Rubritepida flocculans TaxID=182403 RepID=UPI00041A3871|nr:hypothetical protein [Rubritepida flocculans]